VLVVVVVVVVMVVILLVVVVAVVAVIVVVLFVIYSYFSFPNAYELVVYPDIRRIGWTRLHSRTEINICAEYREKAINRNCEK